VLDADRQALCAIDAVRDLKPYRYVCIHAGASTPARRWPPEQFAAVADALAAYGLQIVLTGVAAEAQVVAAVAHAMRTPGINLAGHTDRRSLGALLSDARLVICNDTGVSHLAAALAVPSVVVFLEDARRQWAPLAHERHRSLYDPDGVTGDAVLRHAHDLLQHAPARDDAD
jgi:ADP-heptose:LPS heptosyltransferase